MSRRIAYNSVKENNNNSVKEDNNNCVKENNNNSVKEYNKYFYKGGQHLNMSRSGTNTVNVVRKEQTCFKAKI